MKKISLIGAGQIGGTLAHLCSLRNLGEIVLLDKKGTFAEGKALDIMQSNYIYGIDSKIKGTQNYEDIKNSDVIVITAGVPRKPGMTREDLIQINTEVIKVVAENVKKFSPEAFIVIVTNPLDAMVYAFQKVSELNPKKIVGMAGVLDTARFCHFLSEEFLISKKEINAVVLGGHGDTMVPVIGLTHISGIPLIEYAKMNNISEKRIEEIVQRTRDGGAEIVKLLETGSAYYAPATAAVSMIESYLFDQKRILPCASFLTGEYGIKNLYIGVQSIIGENGVEKIIEIKLTEKEFDMMQKSINSVKDLCCIVDKILAY